VKAALEGWLHQRWYGDVPPGLGLRALAGLYRVLSSRQPPAAERLPVPVIVVGKFTAGGTGKTPLVIALAEYFRDRGYRPGIVSRGHGRKGGQPLRVVASTPVEASGDEPRLMFERTGLPVFVDRDRVAAARAAVDAGCNLVIADDGLQHRRLERDIEIEVVDAQRAYGNGLLLPAGPLRERPRRCDFRVLNGVEAQAEDHGAGGDGDWLMHLRLGDALRLVGGTQAASPVRPLADFLPGPVHAAAGIGHPERFFAALEGIGLSVTRHPFPDHHGFTAADFERMEGPILMTAKDAVKCRHLGLRDAWVIPAEAILPEGFYEAVRSALAGNHART
jgi:tetraacyldisaccharide 4'-kinase